MGFVFYISDGKLVLAPEVAPVKDMENIKQRNVQMKILTNFLSLSSNFQLKASPRN